MREPSLRDLKILLVEDEYLIATELRCELEDLGASVVGPVSTVDAALAAIRSRQDLDGAVVDVNLGGEMAFAVIDLLVERQVPLVLATGYDVQALPPRFAGVERHDKPVDINRIAQSLAKAGEM